MKQKTTLMILKHYYLHFFTVLIMMFFSENVYSQLYSNGAISTGVTHLATSTSAPAGYTWSELQTPAGTLGFSSFYNNALTNDFAIAEEFVVPAGQSWSLTNVNFYGYQTNYAGLTIPIDALRIRIWNGDPSLGTSSVVYGDMTTNVLNAAGSGEEFIYRVSNATGTTRRVWRFNATISTILNPGTYWIEYQVHALNDSSIFMPPVTILNTQSDPNWTAKQRNANTWSGLIDTGSSFNRSMPFQLIGTDLLGIEFSAGTSNFSMYPMPVKEVCNFRLNKQLLENPNSLTIYDFKGALVFKQSNIKSSDFSVNLSSLQTGLYFVKILDKNGKMLYSNKLMKE